MRNCPLCGGTGQVTLEDFVRELENKPGAVGSAHPTTSKKAAKRPSNVVKFGTQRYAVLGILYENGPATCASIAQRVGLSRNQAATRLGECRQVGLVEWYRDENGNIITQPTGKNDEGRVQRLTRAGLLAYEEAFSNAVC